MHDHGSCTSVLNLRYLDGSEGSRTNPAKFKYQDYEHLRDRSLKRGRPFVDASFPPENRSLGNLGLSHAQLRRIEWLRPSEILESNKVSEKPIFCSDGTSHYDFAQGIVSNCWFLAAVGTLTSKKHLIAQVVPLEQSFDNNPGIFHFRFWRYGKWVDVVIDDLLPTINKNLISVKSKDIREFWVPLLEKAYAKVCGSYSDMGSGHPTEACKDFCGGIHMTHKLRRGPAYHDELWTALQRAVSCQSLICCAIDRSGREMVNTVLATGLVEAHAYSVTGITEVDYNGSNVRLVRVLNPWGGEEWNGKWSDKSSMWDRVSSTDRAKLMEREDGEFWIDLSDLDKNFSIVTAACENPNFIDGDVEAQWQCMIYDGDWVAGRSAGGSPNDSSYSDNPQYRLIVKDTRDATDDNNIVVSLMQVPQQQRRQDAKFFPIGTAVYKVPAGSSSRRLGSDFFRNNRPLMETQMYAYSRDIIEEYSLAPGEYVVVPSTMQPYMSCSFVLSVFSKTEAEVRPDDGGHDHDHDHEEEEETRPDSPTVTPEPEEEEMSPARVIFKRYRDQDDLLSSLQLKKLLNDHVSAGGRSGFNYEDANSLISMFDTKRIRMLTFADFDALWRKVNEYKDLFKTVDKNFNGFLSDNEIMRALGTVGWEVQDNLLKLLVSRSPGSSSDLQSFIMIMLRMNKGSQIFTDKSEDGVISMTWTDFSQIFAM